MKKIAVSIFSDALGRVFPQILQLLMSVFFARILSVESFGNLAYLLSLGAIVQTIAELNLPNYIIYSNSFFKIRYYLIISIILFLLLIFSVLFFLSEPLKSVLFVALFGVSSLVSNYTRAIFYIESRIISFNLILVFSVLFSSIFSYFLSFWFKSDDLIFIYNLISQVLLATITLYKIRRHLFDKIYLVLNKFLDEFKYIKGFYIANLFNIFGSNIENIFFSRHLGLLDLGYYNRSKSVESIATNTSLQSLSFVFFTKFSGLKSDNLRYSAKARVISFLLLFFFGLFFASILFFYGSYFVIALYGEKFSRSAELIRYLATLVPSLFMLTWLNMILSVDGKGKFYAIINVVKTLIGLICLFFLTNVGLERYLNMLSIILSIFSSFVVIIYFKKFYESYKKNV